MKKVNKRKQLLIVTDINIKIFKLMTEELIKDRLPNQVCHELHQLKEHISTSIKLIRHCIELGVYDDE